MAGTFRRQPISGGDTGAWAQYVLAHMDAQLGTLTGRIYNDGGVLKLPACRVGIDDGANRGVCDFTAAETISLVGTSNSNWIAITLTVAGTATTLAAADIASATDPTIIPASVKAAFVGLKNGFYLTPTKRLIGLAWKSAAGVLLAVVNFEGSKWWASNIGGNLQNGPGEGFIFPYTGWNADTTGAKTITHNFGVFWLAVKTISASIVPNSGAFLAQVNWAADSADPNLINGGLDVITPTQFSITRRTGGQFDAAAYNAAYGWIHFTMRDF